MEEVESGLTRMLSEVSEEVVLSKSGPELPKKESDTTDVTKNLWSPREEAEAATSDERGWRGVASTSDCGDPISSDLGEAISDR